MTSEGRCVSSRGSCLNPGRGQFHRGRRFPSLMSSPLFRPGTKRSSIHTSPEHFHTDGLRGLSRSRSAQSQRDCSIAHDSCRMSTRTTVRRDPRLLKGQRRRTMEGRWVAAQKPPQQHLAGETSLLVTIRSPTAVVRAPVTSREMAQISRASSCRRERFVKEETGTAKSCLQYCACDWPL